MDREPAADREGLVRAHVGRDADFPEPNFEGLSRRDCGEHRTVGAHRAWCHDCGEWCYPGDPCVRCELPGLRAVVQAARAWKAKRDGMRWPRPRRASVPEQSSVSEAADLYDAVAALDAAERRHR